MKVFVNHSSKKYFLIGVLMVVTEGHISSNFSTGVHSG